jgi:hypothetical protein
MPNPDPTLANAKLIHRSLGERARAFAIAKIASRQTPPKSSRPA